MWKQKKKKKKKPSRLAFPTSRDIKTRLKFGHKRKGISREIATKLRLLVTFSWNMWTRVHKLFFFFFFPLLFLFWTRTSPGVYRSNGSRLKTLIFYNSRELFILRYRWGRLCDKDKPSSKTCACCSATRESAPTGNGTRRKKRSNARCPDPLFCGCVSWAWIFRGYSTWPRGRDCFVLAFD